MIESAKWRGRVLGTSLALIVVGAPLLYQRYRLTTSKRFRVVVPGRVYRSGQMTLRGFEDALRRFGIRTVINVQNEYPDPALRRSFLDFRKVSERELCEKSGVRYVHLEPDLVPVKQSWERQPDVIEQFLALMDDEANYPILIHCKAGLHRTGVLVALYRREYQRWSAGKALEEMKELGFGDAAATSSNLYVDQYVLSYRPREDSTSSGAGTDGSNRQGMR